LSPGGRIFLTQTIQKQPARWLEILKPMLRWATSIDFGRVTYEHEFRAQIRAAGLALEEFTTLSGRGSRASCIAVARPADMCRGVRHSSPDTTSDHDGARDEDR
jgi:hypothetical protein